MKRRDFIQKPAVAAIGASWMAITPMSGQSIAMGITPVYFPDFTNGKWIDRKNTFALRDEY